MNIYQINWVYPVGWELSSVVIASDEKEAISIMNFSKLDEEINVNFLGKAKKDITYPYIVCKEDL